MLGSLRLENQAVRGTRHRRVLNAHKMVSDEAMRRLSSLNGGLAQLGEHLLCKQRVNGSIPLSSTKKIVISYSLRAMNN